MMLNVGKLIAAAKACLGWPYVSPGTNDSNGIDCSGLLVRIFKQQGAYIYHGSNTIYHQNCSKVGKITNENQLRPGMAVFKCKDWDDSQKKNKWYGSEPGNMYHVGLVTGTYPLEITHATPPAVTTDKKLGKWSYYGMLKSVDYDGKVSSEFITTLPEDTEPVQADPNTLSTEGQLEVLDPIYGGNMINAQATVTSENGKPVKLRKKASSKCSVYDELPVGTVVDIVERGEVWTKVNYSFRKGWYMMSKFLLFHKG